MTNEANQQLLREQAEESFGAERGEYLHFDFYAEKEGCSAITPDEAYDLHWRLIYWLKEQGYGFDGGAYLGNWGEAREKARVDEPS